MLTLSGHIYKRFYTSVALMTLLISLVGVFFGGLHFVTGLVCATFFSGLIFLSMVRNVKNLFNGEVGAFLIPGFIFRLACFAIFLYVVLVRLHLSLAGVLIGLMLPVVGFAVGVLYTLTRDPDSF